ncbi:MAG: nucleotide exchange factor GrpE, partial [Armatimonadetes bacterium]|nr:nucleotide exchange factor GrpE [Armatimonadota bacterium]
AAVGAEVGRGPKTMIAVDVLETAEHEDGFVLEVYRPGYRWQGQIHRPAQVKVARNKERSHS